jgi:hypothetical protein
VGIGSPKAMLGKRYYYFDDFYGWDAQPKKDWIDR